jgi:hypothetical protein
MYLPGVFLHLSVWNPSSWYCCPATGTLPMYCCLSVLVLCLFRCLACLCFSPSCLQNVICPPCWVCPLLQCYPVVCTSPPYWFLGSPCSDPATGNDLFYCKLGLSDDTRFYLMSSDLRLWNIFVLPFLQKILHTNRLYPSFPVIYVCLQVGRPLSPVSVILFCRPGMGHVWPERPGMVPSAVFLPLPGFYQVAWKKEIESDVEMESGADGQIVCVCVCVCVCVFTSAVLPDQQKLSKWWIQVMIAPGRLIYALLSYFVFYSLIFYKFHYRNICGNTEKKKTSVVILLFTHSTVYVKACRQTCLFMHTQAYVTLNL